MPASNWQGPLVRERSERFCGREDAAAEPRLRGDIRTAHGVSRGYRRPADPSPVRGGIMLIARATVALCRPFRAQRIGDSYPRLTPWADISRPCRGSVSNGSGVATPPAVVPQFRVPQFRVPSLLFTCQTSLSGGQRHGPSFPSSEFLSSGFQRLIFGCQTPVFALRPLRRTQGKQAQGFVVASPGAPEAPSALSRDLPRLRAQNGRLARLAARQRPAGPSETIF